MQAHKRSPRKRSLPLAMLMLTVTAVLCIGCTSGTIVAIDMGSEFLKIAAPKDTSIEVCLNEQSHRKSDTWIGFRGEERFFGADAKSLSARFPDAMIPAVPRLVGVPHDAAFQQGWLNKMRYTYHTASSGTTRGTVNVTFPASEGVEERQYTADELMGMMLGYAKTQAEREISGPVRDAILVVPRGYTSRQRQAMVDAAAITGLRVLSFIHPTTAAALQLGLQNRGLGDEPQHVLIYDMGSTKTEAAVYRFDPIATPAAAAKGGKKSTNSFGTISLVGSIASDMTLGGRAVDACLAEFIENAYMTTAPTAGKQRVLTGTTPQSRKAVMSLLRAANKAKEMLSANREAPVTVEGIAQDSDFSLRISRATLERECGGIWDRAVRVRDAALKSANVTLAQLSRFEVVGGGLRVPIIIEKLSEGYNKAGSGVVDRTLNSDEAMVVGAGYYGAALSGHFRIKGFRLVERLGFPVWITVALNSSSNTEATGTAEAPSSQQRKLLFPSEARLPTRLRVRVNATVSDFIVTLDETTNSSSSATIVSKSNTLVSGVLGALQQVGYGDVDAADRNITHTVWVDIRASEAAMVYIEKAEIEIHYFVNASRKVRKLVTPPAEEKNASDGDASASPATEKTTPESGEEQPSTAEDAGGDSASDEGEISDEAPDATTTSSSSKPSASDDITEGAKKASKDSTAPKKKPTYVTVTEVHVEARSRVFPLTLTTTFASPAVPMSKNESILSRDLLRRWRRSDELHLQKSAARNDLEAYLIWALSDGFVYNDEALKVVGSQEEMDTTAEKLRELQNWLEDAGTEATVPTEDLQAKLRQAKLIVRTALREAPTVEETKAPKAPSVTTESAETAAEGEAVDEEIEEGDDDGADSGASRDEL
ncbi:heat shock protein 70-like, putative [Bodo saltans]|uniref:Heat shock protein 70-like, putative n=1 Tax=Bodo saltans TaxID=75058 RepID=A0A0S4IUZ2_BODSA|nr:heat shock protein 70-like, putative [Bodo saltans]|eukprot:CUF98600.1 heat shock protein 70-like, putative [Bodo saltans]